jgi:hypothetical protein
MSNENTALSMDVVISERAAMEAELEAAVGRAREAAMKDGTAGILVTRKSPTTFTVAVSEEVPYGITQEQQAW